MIELMPICVARKPFEGTVAQNVLKHGTGAINIDACRVGNEIMETGRKGRISAPGYDGGWKDGGCKGLVHGRWPANLIHDGSKEVTDLFPMTAPTKPHKIISNIESYEGYGNITRKHGEIVNYEEGNELKSAARFFYCCKDKAELKEYLIKLVTPKGENMKDNYLLLLGKSEEVLKSLEDNSIDSIVTDPPYELGFMGKKWDSTGIAYNVDLWKECLRVLKPGGHLLSFGGTRTSHRMVCAIEDAGFEIRDTIMWVYGSGFPKSMNVSKAIDREAGAEREKIKIGDTVKRMIPGADQHKTGSWIKDNGREYQPGIELPATELAKKWEGWGTALKPAVEPICVARKPIEGTVAQNVLEHGTGAINIDACRVELNGDYKSKPNGRPSLTGLGDNYDPDKANTPDIIGRWPANFIHDGSKEVIELFPDTGKSSGGRNCNISKTSEIYGGGKGLGQNIDSESVKGDPGYGDIGSAARFFYCAKSSKSDRDEGCEDEPDRFMAASNQAQAELARKIRKNNHPTVKPIELMKYLVRLVTPPKGTILDPFCGSGSTGKAAIIEGFKFIGIDNDPIAIDIAKKRINYASKKRFKVDIWENLLS